MSPIGTGVKSYGSVSFMDNESKLMPRNLSCNYPANDPVFYIPKIPELTRVPDPKPPKQAPLAGVLMADIDNGPVETIVI